MTEGSERRKHRRIRFETRVDLVYKGVNGFASVRTGNLSASGMFVTQSQPPAPGTPVDFGLMVGAKGLHRGSGEVVWVRPAEGAGEHPAGFGLRFLSFREGSPELIAELVTETLAGADLPTDHGAEEPTAPAETLATRVPTAPIGVDERAEPSGARAVSDRTTAVLTLATTPATSAAPAPAEAAEAEGASEVENEPPATAAGGEGPAGVATLVTPVSELVADGVEAPPAEPPAKASTSTPIVPTEERPAGAATVTAPIADLTADASGSATPGPVPPPAGPDAEPQGTTVFDVRQAMAAMQEFQREAKSSDAAPAAPAPVAPAAAQPPAPPAAPAEGKPAEGKPASEPARPAPAKPAASAAKAAAAVPAKPAPARHEEKPAPAAPAPAEVKRKERPPRRPMSKGLLRLAVLVLVAGAVYVVSTQTQWGRETTPVVVAWVEGTWAKVTGKPQPDPQSPSLGPMAVAATPTEADQIVEVTWEGEGPTTLVTVTANGPLTDERVLHEELARPPRSLIRVKGIRRPFSGFQERTDVPNLVGLRVGHHFELHPPELFVVVEPVAGAKVARVQVSESAILIEVALEPTPKPKRGR